MKMDQLRNPEYTNIPMTTAPRYSQLISALHAMTRKINSTIAFNKVCLDSDDEDCFRNPFQNCRDSTPAKSTPAESGSGSGSDSGIFEITTDGGNEDTATVRPTIAVSTTQQRIFPMPLDNNVLRDEMVPSTPSIGRPTTDQSKGLRMDNFDNTIPGGKKEKPLEPPGTSNPIAVSSSEGIETTEALARATELSSDSATEETTTARIQGDVHLRETTSPGNELTSGTETDTATDAATQAATEDVPVEQIPQISSNAVVSSSMLLLCIAAMVTGVVLNIPY